MASPSSTSLRTRAPLPLETAVPALLGLVYARIALAVPEELVPDAYRDLAVALGGPTGTALIPRLLLARSGPAHRLAADGVALADALVPPLAWMAWFGLDADAETGAATDVAPGGDHTVPFPGSGSSTFEVADTPIDDLLGGRHDRALTDDDGDDDLASDDFPLTPAETAAAFVRWVTGPGAPALPLQAAVAGILAAHLAPDEARALIGPACAPLAEALYHQLCAAGGATLAGLVALVPLTWPDEAARRQIVAAGIEEPSPHGHVPRNCHDLADLVAAHRRQVPALPPTAWHQPMGAVVLPETPAHCTVRALGLPEGVAVIVQCTHCGGRADAVFEGPTTAFGFSRTRAQPPRRLDAAPVLARILPALVAIGRPVFQDFFAAHGSCRIGTTQADEFPSVVRETIASVLTDVDAQLQRGTVPATAFLVIDTQGGVHALHVDDLSASALGRPNPLAGPVAAWAVRSFVEAMGPEVAAVLALAPTDAVVCAPWARPDGVGPHGGFSVTIVHRRGARAVHTPLGDGRWPGAVFPLGTPQHAPLCTPSVWVDGLVPLVWYAAPADGGFAGASLDPPSSNGSVPPR